jgi:hypothetical protein
MYLVERRPGREELYRSEAELAAAIDRGEVDSASRIFHRATSTWISITLHPLFKARTAERSQDPAPPLPPLPRKSWTFLPVEAPSQALIPPATELDTEGPGAKPGDSKRPQRSGIGPFRGLRRILHG